MSLELRLSQDILERQTVLTEIEKVLFTGRYNLSNKHYEIFSVQSIAMIYSIWEGYIQTSFNTYIEQINQFQLDLGSLSDNLYIYHMETKFLQLKSYPERSQKKLQFYSDLMNHYQNKIVNIRSGIQTKSNLDFSVLNELMISFHLQSFPEYWGNYKHPNPSLKEMLKMFINYRNTVAHGGDIRSQEKVTQEVFDKYKKLINELMVEVQLRMLDGLSSRSYLKSA